MSEFAESDFLPISALQHLAFCERQWGLIHLEQLWEENRLTAEGKLLHEKVDEGPDETRDGVRTVRSLALRSFRLGLIGKSDVVEFPKEPGAAPLPVEYKRGRPKLEHWDEIQLCAQALCLEEMMGVPVILGAIYYGQPRRRVDVAIGESLRAETETLVARMHELMRCGKTPPAVYEKKCRSCSLFELCQPKTMQGRKSAIEFLRAAVRTSLEDNE